MKLYALLVITLFFFVSAVRADNLVPDLALAKRLADAAADADYAIITRGAPIVVDGRKGYTETKVAEKAWLTDCAKIFGGGIFQPRSSIGLWVSSPFISFYKDGSMTASVTLAPGGTDLLVVESKSVRQYRVGKKLIDMLTEHAKEKPANQALEPTPPSVTPRADARVAPAGSVAHL